VRREIVDRNLDRRSLGQRVEMPDQELGLQRIRMVEVDLVPLFGRQRVEVAVVGVVRDPLDALFADAVVDRAGDRRLP
jgi:hypothetical protein